MNVEASAAHGEQLWPRLKGFGENREACEHSVRRVRSYRCTRKVRRSPRRPLYLSLNSLLRRTRVSTFSTRGLTRPLLLPVSDPSTRPLLLPVSLLQSEGLREREARRPVAFEDADVELGLGEHRDLPC